MNYEWSLPQSSLAFIESMRRRQEVLLSYDGPALVTLTDGQSQFLGMAVDEDESGDVVRWIEAPVSDLELDAIKIGAEPLRWALSKERVTVIDYSRHEPVRMWDVALDSIPQEALPDPDAFLPGSRKEKAASPIERPMFSLAGKTAPNRVTFGELSAVATTLQSLWNAFAQSLNTALAPLAVTAFARGSLKMLVDTDNPVTFGRIANEYRKLVLASDSRQRLAEVIATVDARVASTYRDYLQTLRIHEVEVLAEWREQASFVSYRTATRARENYPTIDAIPQAPVTKERARLRGVFQGFLRDEGFQFYDLDGNKWYRGRLGKALRNNLPDEFDMTLGRGLHKRYIVEIEITRKGDKETHRLLNYADAPEGRNT
jgi:hypothetical protein